MFGEDASLCGDSSAALTATVGRTWT